MATVDLFYLIAIIFALTPSEATLCWNAVPHVTASMPPLLDVAYFKLCHFSTLLCGCLCCHTIICHNILLYKHPHFLHSGYCTVPALSFFSTHFPNIYFNAISFSSHHYLSYHLLHMSLSPSLLYNSSPLNVTRLPPCILL